MGTCGRASGISWSSAWIGWACSSGPDGDGGERRDEESRIEHAFDDGEDVGVHRDLLERLAVHEEVVDARTCAGPRRGCRRGRSRARARVRAAPVDLVHELRLDGVGQHGVAVRRDALEVGVEVGEGTRRRGRRRSAAGIRGLGWCHGRNSMDGAAACLRQALAFRHVGWRIGPVVGSLSRAVGAVGSALA